MKSLKIALWISALACLAAVPFIVLPWEIIEDIMMGFGLNPLPDVPMVIYLIRIFSGVSGLIGIFFIMLAKNPLGYGAMLNLAAYGLIGFGFLVLILGLNLKIPLTVFVGDAVFGIIFGVVIAILSTKIKKTQEAEKETGIRG